MSGNQPAVFRRPESVLVVVYTDDGHALLLRRITPIDMWQSVTGTLEPGELHADAAARELFEETGLRNEGTLEATGTERVFTIDPRWRHRYAPGVVENREYEWRYRLPSTSAIEFSNSEHAEYCWMPIGEAATVVWSWSNRDALALLTETA